MRLIDADATLRGIDTTIALLRVASGSDKIKNKAVDMVQHTRDFVAQMEVIDASPVVRCKDCKHWLNEDGLDDHVCLKIYSDGAVSSYAWQFREPNDFCSYGVRKDGDT